MADNWYALINDQRRWKWMTKIKKALWRKIAFKVGDYGGPHRNNRCLCARLWSQKRWITFPLNTRALYNLCYAKPVDGSADPYWITSRSDKRAILNNLFIDTKETKGLQFLPCKSNTRLCAFYAWLTVKLFSRWTAWHLYVLPLTSCRILFVVLLWSNLMGSLMEYIQLSHNLAYRPSIFVPQSDIDYSKLPSCFTFKRRSEN